MFYGAPARLTKICAVSTPATALLSGAFANASPYDLTTVAQVLAEPAFAINPPNSAWLQRIITACSTRMARYCNRGVERAYTFAVQTYQDTIFPIRDPPPRVTVGGMDPLQMAQWPIVAANPSTVGVTENGVTLTENTDFIVDYALGTLTRQDPNANYIIPWDEWPLVISYQAGFAPADADFAILADAAIEFVKFRYFSATRDPGLKSIEIPGDFSASYLWGTGPGGPDDMPAVISGMIDRYRVPVIA